MRKFMLAAAFAVSSLVAAAPASAVTISPDGTWHQADEFHAVGEFFATTWDFVCAGNCRLDVSDWAVISDMFEVFDNAVSIGVTSVRDNWDVLGCSDAFDGACYVTDADTAWADDRFSKGSFTLGAGAHLISIKSTAIPPISVGGSPFGDSTVQLRVSVAAVPLPAGFGLLAAGLAGLGLVGRRRRQG